jgi:hypothetical protein
MRYEPILKANIAQLFASLSKITGLKESTLAKAILRYPGFPQDLPNQRLVVGYYDDVAGKFYSVWPHDVAPWPDTIPVPDLVEAPESAKRTIRRALSGDFVGPKFGRPREERWPAGVPWPGDIPPPAPGIKLVQAEGV